MTVRNSTANDADVAKSNGKRLAKTLAWSTLHAIIPTISSAAIFFGGAVFLSPDDFGMVALCLAIVLMATAASPLAFGDALVQKKSLEDIDCSSVLWLNLSFSLLLYFVIFLLAPFVGTWTSESEIALYLQVLALRIPFGLVAIVPQSILVRRLEYRSIAIRTAVATAFSLSLCFTLLLMDFGAWALIASQVSNSVILAITGFIATKWVPKIAFSWQAIKGIAGYGMFASGDRFLSMARFDQIVLGILVSLQGLGLYYFAQRIYTMVIQVLLQAVGGFLHSYLSRLQHSRSQIRKSYAQFTLFASSLGFIIFASIFVMSDDLISWLLKPEWLAAVVYVQLFCVLGVFSVMEFLHGALMRSQGQSRQWFYYRAAQEFATILVIAALFNVSVTAILIGLIVKSFAILPFQLRMSARILGVNSRRIVEWSSAPLVATLLSVAVSMVVSDAINETHAFARLVGEVLSLVVTYFSVLVALERKQIWQLRSIFGKA